MIFNPDKHYLGSLCKRGHDYEGTGKSLRRIGFASCILCKKEYAREWSLKNRARRNEINRSWDAKNQERKKTQAKESKKKQADCLGDSYLKYQLIKALPINRSQITTELIELKRVKILFHRELKKIRRIADELFRAELSNVGRSDRA